MVAAEVKGFKLTDVCELDWARNISRMSQLAIAGAVLALRDAGISVERLREANPVVTVGSALMDPQVIQGSILDVERKGVRYARPRLVREAIGSATSASVIHALEVRAQAISYQTACCAGVDAIGFGADLVARGEADIAIAGGTEAPIYQHPMLELKAAGLAPGTHELADRLGRPFDLWRTTGVIGEGACFVILEPEDSPRPGYAFVRGFGYASDQNGDICGGLSRAVRSALANARLSPGSIDHISAWGPGHRLIDAAEAKAMEAVFGETVWNIPAYSIKGAIGNPFAAAGAIQTAAAALGLQSGALPPTVNWERADPACPFSLSNRVRWVDSTFAMINAHGVSGTNSCLILERC
jgi:3-oxoacyl-(acyl-carrier-protein) synthase